jgi:hypothetical protein
MQKNIYAIALQFVRKVSGYQKSSTVNEITLERVVD